MSPIPRLLVTPGEPAGIGPDLCLLHATQATSFEWVAVGDPSLLHARAKVLGLDIRIEEISLSDSPTPCTAGTIKVLSHRLGAVVQAGQLSPANARYVLDCLTAAARACVGGQADALVTGPVHKGVINDAGTPFTGHTEFIADLTGGHPVMMLATEGLRVALVTTHLPLREVPAAITADRVRTTVRILHRDLRQRFGLTDPRITVCGLNPHAGEGGHLGREELEIIEPTLALLAAEGIATRGPLPADTAFTPPQMERTDAFLAMYHDQGLAVLKHKGFGRAVNITLGLPIVRTSVDHGTALDLAGTGQADTGSFAVALENALIMCRYSTP